MSNSSLASNNAVRLGAVALLGGVLVYWLMSQSSAANPPPPKTSSGAKKPSAKSTTTTTTITTTTSIKSAKASAAAAGSSSEAASEVQETEKQEVSQLAKDQSKSEEEVVREAQVIETKVISLPESPVEEQQIQEQEAPQPSHPPSQTSVSVADEETATEGTDGNDTENDTVGTDNEDSKQDTPEVKESVTLATAVETEQLEKVIRKEQSWYSEVMEDKPIESVEVAAVAVESVEVAEDAEVAVETVKEERKNVWVEREAAKEADALREISKVAEKSELNAKAAEFTPSWITNPKPNGHASHASEGSTASSPRAGTEVKKPATRCKFWPKCTNKSCKFTHPSQPCRNPEKCTFGDRCLFIHPRDNLTRAKPNTRNASVNGLRSPRPSSSGVSSRRPTADSQTHSPAVAHEVTTSA